MQDGSTPDTAVIAYERLLEVDGVQVFLGPYSSTMTQLPVLWAEQNKRLLVHSTASADSLFAPTNRYTFGLNTLSSKFMVRVSGAVADVHRLWANGTGGRGAQEEEWRHTHHRPPPLCLCILITASLS